MTDQNEIDMLEKVRAALDSGIIENNHNKTGSDDVEHSGEATDNGTSEVTTEQVPQNYIDVEDYCKLLQDYRVDSVDHMDSRNLIAAQQAKLDSQQTSHNIVDLHDRISSFDMLRWSQKPDCVSSFQCARFGWKLTEWGFLACVTCKKILPVPSQIPKTSGSAWAERLRKAIESSGHLPTCPWVRIPSSEDILCIPTGPDLVRFLRESVDSFKLMKTVPTLENHYNAILDTLNLEWLCELTSSSLVDENQMVDKSVTPESIRKVVLFLVVNGWTVDAEDLMRCQLCLREVPLWLCQPNPPQNDILDLLSPPASPAETKKFSYKEFNPVNNHWSWCPWHHKLLPPSIPDRKEGDKCEDKSRKQANIEDYERVLKEFKHEYCKNSLSYDKEKSHVQLIGSVTSLFDNFVGSLTVRPNIDLNQSDSTEKDQNNDELPVSSDNVSDEQMPPITTGEEQSDDVAAPPKKRIRREFFEAGANI